jgi:hypothetical protein
VRVLAYADDCYLQGPAEEVTAAFAAFRDALLLIGLEIVPGKSCAYSEDSDAAAFVAQTVGIPHAETRFVAAGTPIGSDAFMAGHLQALLNATEQELAALGELQLPGQDRLILLRWSFHPRFAHLPRTIPAAQLVCGIHHWGRRLHTVVAGMVEWDAGDKFPADIDAQFALPIRFGGLGLSGWTDDHADAVFLASVRLAHDALEGGAPAFQPFAGPYGAQLGPYPGARWEHLRPLGPATWQERPLDLMPP